MPFEGKGTSVRTPISTPYTKQIGNYVKFIMNISKEQIDISTNLQDISNYVYLLNLKNRYANPQIYNYLLNLGNSLYSDIIQYENNLGKKLTDSELNNYITTAKKHDKKHIPLYFALMSIYNNYDNYILYLHTYPHTIYCLCTFLFYALLHRFKLQYIFYQLYDRIVFIQILKHHRIIYICCHCLSYFRCGK